VFDQQVQPVFFDPEKGDKEPTGEGDEEPTKKGDKEPTELGDKAPTEGGKEPTNLGYKEPAVPVPVPEQAEQKPAGSDGDGDPHGCNRKDSDDDTTGYQWCEALSKCTQPGKEPCESKAAARTEAEAYQSALSAKAKAEAAWDAKQKKKAADKQANGDIMAAKHAKAEAAWEAKAKKEAAEKAADKVAEGYRAEEKAAYAKFQSEHAAAPISTTHHDAVSGDDAPETQPGIAPKLARAMKDPAGQSYSELLQAEERLKSMLAAKKATINAKLAMHALAAKTPALALPGGANVVGLIRKNLQGRGEDLGGQLGSCGRHAECGAVHFCANREPSAHSEAEALGSGVCAPCAECEIPSADSIDGACPAGCKHLEENTALRSGGSSAAKSTARGGLRDADAVAADVVSATGEDTVEAALQWLQGLAGTAKADLEEAESAASADLRTAASAAERAAEADIQRCVALLSLAAPACRAALAHSSMCCAQQQPRLPPAGALAAPPAPAPCLYGLPQPLYLR
jgi:hypothetical protein